MKTNFLGGKTTAFALALFSFGAQPLLAANPVNLRMTDVSSRLLVQAVLQQADLLQSWSQDLKKAGVTDPNVVQSAACVARVLRPMVDEKKPLVQKKESRVDCDITTAGAVKKAALSLEGVMLDGWGRLETLPFTISGALANNLYQAIDRQITKAKGTTEENLYYISGICDPGGNACLESRMINRLLIPIRTSLHWPLVAHAIRVSPRSFQKTSRPEPRLRWQR